MAAMKRRTPKVQKVGAPKPLYKSSDAPKRVIVKTKDSWSGKVRTPSKPAPMRGPTPSESVTLVNRTVVPDVTNVDTYKRLRAKVEADLRADRRNAQLAALRSLLPF